MRAPTTRAKECQTIVGRYGEGIQLTTNLWGNIGMKDTAILTENGLVTVVRTAGIR